MIGTILVDQDLGAFSTSLPFIVCSIYLVLHYLRRIGPVAVLPVFLPMADELDEMAVGPRVRDYRPIWAKCE